MHGWFTTSHRFADDQIKGMQIDWGNLADDRILYQLISSYIITDRKNTQAQRDVHLESDFSYPESLAVSFIWSPQKFSWANLLSHSDQVSRWTLSA